jgi:hypothetical protein
MFPNPWLLIPLMLAFIVALSLKGERDRKWVFTMWFPVMAIAIGGTLLLLYAVISALSLSRGGPDTGLAGLGCLMLAGCSLPFLLLLYLCLKYRPGPQAYTMRYVLPTVLAVVLVIVLLFVLVRFFGVSLHIWECERVSPRIVTL